MSLTMTKEEREAFLADVHVGVISVAKMVMGRLRFRSGIPMTWRRGPSHNGSGVRKGKLLERAGRFSLCAQTETPPYKYVSVEGPIVAIEAADLERDRRPLARRYLGAELGDRYIESTRTSSGTCLFVCGRSDGLRSTTQSIPVTVNANPANRALQPPASRAAECDR